MNKLQAVNYVLKKVCGYVVSALDTDGTSEQAFVERFLDDETLIVAAERWHYNTRVNVTLTPNATTGEIALPTGTTSIDTTREDSAVDVTTFGNKLYDRENNTDDFSDRDSLKVEHTVAMQWGCMPEYVRHYVAAKAARVFAESPRKMMTQLLPSLRHEEQRLRTIAKRRDAENADVNILNTTEAINFKGRDPSTTPYGGSVFPTSGIGGGS